MSGMTAPRASWLPRGRTLVADDLASAPDDGHRYELLDGSLLVTPSPLPLHQRAVVRLTMLLGGACPEDLEVFVAPFDVRLAENTVLQPDVLVVRRADLTEQRLDGIPLLAVEVLSPSTRNIDLMLKHDRYARAGCAAYWVVDTTGAGRVTAWVGHAGRFELAADVQGDESFAAIVPFDVTVVPRDLLT